MIACGDRKVYFECNSHSLTQFESAVRKGFLVEEARLPAFERFGPDDWSDLVWLSIDRSTFHDKKTLLTRPPRMGRPTFASLIG